MGHPADRGERRAEYLARRASHGSKRNMPSDEVPFLDRFAQLPRPTREARALRHDSEMQEAVA